MLNEKGGSSRLRNEVAALRIKRQIVGLSGDDWPGKTDRHEGDSLSRLAPATGPSRLARPAEREFRYHLALVFELLPPGSWRGECAIGLRLHRLGPTEQATRALEAPITAGGDCQSRHWALGTGHWALFASPNAQFPVPSSQPPVVSSFQAQQQAAVCLVFWSWETFRTAAGPSSVPMPRLG